MGQQTDENGSVQHPKQQQSPADIVHEKTQSVSDLDADSESSVGLESSRIDSQKGGTSPESYAVTESPCSASIDANITADIGKNPDSAPDADSVRSSVEDVGNDAPPESPKRAVSAKRTEKRMGDRSQNDEPRPTVVPQHGETEVPENISEGIENTTRLCATCKKHKDQKEFRDRRFTTVRFTKNCLECREEKRPKKAKGPMRRSGRGKPEKEKKGGEAPRASAQKVHDKNNSAAKPEAQGGTVEDSKTDSNASTTHSQKRRLPADFDNQGPKKQAKVSKKPMASQEPTKTTKQPTAGEPSTPIEKPATDAKYQGLDTAEDQDLAQEAKESEQPEAVNKAEPKEKVTSPATVDQSPAKLDKTDEKPESHETVDIGEKVVTSQSPGGDGPDSTRPGPSSPWSVAYDRTMPFTEAEFALGRDYLLGTASLVSLHVQEKAQPAEELLVRAQRGLVCYLGAALPALQSRLRSAPWCLRARRWLQYKGDLARVAVARARAEHPLLPLVVGDAAMRRRFRGALGQVVLDQADRDPLAVEQAWPST